MPKDYQPGLFGFLRRLIAEMQDKGHTEEEMRRLLEDPYVLQQAVAFGRRQLGHPMAIDIDPIFDQVDQDRGAVTELANRVIDKTDLNVHIFSEPGLDDGQKTPIVNLSRVEDEDGPSNIPGNRTIKLLRFPKALRYYDACALMHDQGMIPTTLAEFLRCMRLHHKELSLLTQPVVVPGTTYTSLLGKSDRLPIFVASPDKKPILHAERSVHCWPGGTFFAATVRP